MAESSPHRWWAGPYDVEHLAATAVSRVGAAVAELAASRGMDIVVDSTPGLVAASFAAYENLRLDGRTPETWADLSGFVAARDGWVRLHGNYPHHAAVIRDVLRIDDRPGLERAVARRDVADIEESISAAGGIAVAVRTREEWEAHPHARATDAVPWSEVRERGDRPDLGRQGGRRASGSSEVGGPDGAAGSGRGARALLDGVRVLDLTRVIAGPTCSQLLACLGADVLRVDPPHRPEILAQYLSTGMGKRSAEIDLEHDADRVCALAAGADVVLDGCRPGALERFGLGVGDLEVIAPRAVIVSLSAWGETGPWGARAGFDSIVQAATGIAAACGTPERPGALPVQALDHASGHLMATHVIDSLTRSRADTVRISLLGAARALLDAPAPSDESPAVLDVPRVRIPSAHGLLDAVPPPLRIDGATLERPVGRYGAAPGAWEE